MFPVLFTIAGFKFPAFTLFLIVALLLGLFFFWKNAVSDDQDENFIFDIAAVAFVSAIVGGRLFYYIFNPQLFLTDPGSFFYPSWRVGFSFWGASLFSVGFLFAFCRVKKKNPLKILDYLPLGVAAGAVLVHLGLLLDGRGLGRPTDLPWGTTSFSQPVPSHPISVYFAIFFLTLFLLIRRLQRRIHHGGFFLLFFLSSFSLISFVVEFSSNSQLYFGRLPQNQALAGIFLLFSLGCWYLFARRSLKRDCQTLGDGLGTLQKSLTNKEGRKQIGVFLTAAPKKAVFSSISWLRGPW